MRTPIVLLALALLAAAPAGVAHTGDHREHLSVTVGTIAPSSENVYRLSFEGGPFAAGWILFVYGGVNENDAGAAAVLTLRTEDNATTVASWVWTPGGFHLNSTRLPVEGEYWLTIVNPSESTEIQVALYYDQSCECLDKVVGLAGGPALFNLHVNAGRHVTYDLLISHISPPHGEPIPPQGVRTEVTVTRLVDERALWPDDFQVVQRATTDRARMQVEWTADAGGIYYVWVTPLTGASPQQPVHYRPLVDISAADGGGAPGLGLVVAFLAVGVAAAAVRIRGTR